MDKKRERQTKTETGEERQRQGLSPPVLLYKLQERIFFVRTVPKLMSILDKLDIIN